MRSQLQTPDRVVLLLALVPYLREHGPTPVNELAETFDVEPALLRKLVRFLGTAGVPGETQSYQHEDLFDIDWTALEDEDLVSLTHVVAVDDTPRFSAAERAALIAGLQMLTGMLPTEERERAERTAAKLAGAFGDTAPPSALSVTADPQDARVPLLVGAIGNGHRVAFAYRDARGSESARSVEPLQLRQSSGAWYLRAFCLERGEERTFRIDRMRDLRELDEAAARPASAAPATRFSAGAASGPAAQRGRIRVRLDAAPRLADFGLETGPVGRDGWADATVDLWYPGTAVALVQAAPGAVEIVSPESARAAVRAWAEQALGLYDDERD